MIVNISSSMINLNERMGSGRNHIMASGSTIRLTTDCPSELGNTCTSCKHEGFRDVLKLSQYKIYRRY